jgi:hypothetical protein
MWQLAVRHDVRENLVPERPAVTAMIARSLISPYNQYDTGITNRAVLKHGPEKCAAVFRKDRLLQRAKAR